jgi:hypothetical protein
MALGLSSHFNIKSWVALMNYPLLLMCISNLMDLIKTWISEGIIIHILNPRFSLSHMHVLCLFYFLYQNWVWDYGYKLSRNETTFNIHFLLLIWLQIYTCLRLFNGYIIKPQPHTCMTTLFSTISTWKCMYHYALNYHQEGIMTKLT